MLSAHLVTAPSAHAQAAMEFIPAVSLFTVFDDNIFATENGDAGRMLFVRPSVEGSYETPVLSLLGLYSFDMQRSNFTSLTTLDARRHAYGATTYRADPRTTMAVTALYDRTDTPGEIDADVGFLGVRQTATRVELAPTIARQLGPRTTLSGGYGWTSDDVVDGQSGTMQAGRVGWSRNMTNRTVITVSYVPRYFLDHIDRLANYYSNTVLAEWARIMSPGTTLTLAAGPKARKAGGAGVEASASWARATPRAALTLDYWHGETIVLGVAGPVAVDSATARVTWPLSPRFEVSTALVASDLTTLDDRSSTAYGGSVIGAWSRPGSIYGVAASYDLNYQDGSIRNPVFLDGERVFFDQQVFRHVFRVNVTVAPRYRRSILPPEEAARAKGVTR